MSRAASSPILPPSGDDPEGCTNRRYDHKRAVRGFSFFRKKRAEDRDREVIFWHNGLMESRPPRKILKRLHEHLGYSARTGKQPRAAARFTGLCFASLAREQVRQIQPFRFQEPATRKRRTPGMATSRCGGISVRFLDLPQVTWMFSENGATRGLNVRATGSFLDRAKNVFGWKDDGRW